MSAPVSPNNARASGEREKPETPVSFPPGNASASAASISEMVDLVRSTPRLIPVGKGTKSRLSRTDAVRISTTKLAGITEYDPGEYTFTALAGTPLAEIIAVLN